MDTSRSGGRLGEQLMQSYILEFSLCLLNWMVVEMV